MVRGNMTKPYFAALRCAALLKCVLGFTVVKFKMIANLTPKFFPVDTHPLAMIFTASAPPSMTF